jgi:hypothetical protein
MGAVDKAALALTQCRTCLGCNLLDDDTFRGDNDCLNYTKAPADVMVERRYGKEDDDERTWKS